MTAHAEYDELPYDDFPFPETHPAHLFVLGSLFGLAPPPVRECRVLELGCGRCGNLIPLAQALPNARFVGVDLSSLHIAVARDDIEALALSNIEAITADISSLTPDLGTFDYILCHGVYSWVPREVQRHILRVCRALLAPDGLSYISYNTLPGWHLRGLIRDVLVRESGEGGPVEARLGRARDLLSLLSHLPDTGAASWIRGEVELLSSMSDAYLRYEHLAKHNHPVYFRDFAIDAARAGLTHVTDAHDWARSTEQLAPEAREWINERSKNLLDTEHYLDLLQVRFFRRSVLCNKEHLPNRRIEHSRLHGLWLSADIEIDPEAPPLVSDTEETFKGPGGVTLTAAPPLLRAALRHLAGAPRGAPFGELAKAALGRLLGSTDEETQRLQPAGEDIELLGGNLLGLATQGVIELWPGPRPYTLSPGERPAATPIAQRQAASGAPACTSLKHRRVAVDSLDRSLLARMDGTRTRDALVQGALDDIAGGLLRIEAEGAIVSDRGSVEELVRQKLIHLSRRGFLVP